MKLGSRSIAIPTYDVVPIVREGEETFYFKLGPVNLDDFDEYYPEPKVPWIQKPGEPAKSNPDDPTYKEKMEKRGEARTHFMIIQSLAATEDLTWDRVKLDDPETYPEWENELKEANVLDVEIMRLQNAAFKVNGLNETVIEAEKKAFFQRKRREENQKS